MRHQGLWTYAMAAVVVNVLLLAALVGAGVYYVGPWIDAGQMRLESWATDTGWQSLVSVLSWLFWMVVILVVLVGAGMTLMLVGQAVASPFLDILSEKTESAVLAEPEPPFSIWRSIRGVFVALADLVWSVVFLVCIHGPLFVLGLIPGLGTMPAAIFEFLV